MSMQYLPCWPNFRRPIQGVHDYMAFTCPALPSLRPALTYVATLGRYMPSRPCKAGNVMEGDVRPSVAIGMPSVCDRRQAAYLTLALPGQTYASTMPRHIFTSLTVKPCENKTNIMIYLIYDDAGQTGGTTAASILTAPRHGKQPNVRRLTKSQMHARRRGRRGCPVAKTRRDLTTSRKRRHHREQRGHYK